MKILHSLFQKNNLHKKILLSLKKSKPFTSTKEQSIETIEPKQKSNKVKLFFFGNEDFSLPSLVYLHKRKYIKTLSSKENPDLDISDLEVISTPVVNSNKKQTVFHSFVSSKSIPQTNIENENWDSIYESIKSCHDKISCLGVLVSFGKMIPNSIIDVLSSTTNKGLYILHPSLLPNYKGGAPIHHVLLNKEAFTGVSLISASKERFDSGKIYLQRQVEIFPYYRYSELSNVLSEECVKVLSEFIDNFNSVTSNEVKEAKEDKEMITIQSKEKLVYAKIIKDKNQSFLDFSNQTSDRIMCIYKAFYGSNQEPWSFFQYGIHKKHLFFDNLFLANTSISMILENDSVVKKNVKPGSLYWDFKLDNENLYIKTNNGWIVSSKVKIEGFAYLNAQDFVKNVLKNQKIDKQKGCTFGNFVYK